MAAAMANGGDGCVRTRERESEGEERKNRGRVREYGGAWRRSRASRLLEETLTKTMMTTPVAV